MKPVSTRWSLVLIALLAAAAVPVWLHVVRAPRMDDCADPEALRDIAAIPRTREIQIREPLEHVRAHLTQWSAGSYTPATGGLPRAWVRIMRSFDPRWLYLEPTRALRGRASQEFSSESPALEWIDAGAGAALERLPIHVVRLGVMGQERVAAWLYIYDGRPVAHPFRAQLASALPQVFAGARPLTLLIAHAVGQGIPPVQIEAALGDWLAAAWRRYQSVCRPGGA